MIKALVGIIAGVGALVGGLFMHQAPAAPQLGSFSPTGGGTYRLLSSIGTADTSVNLSSFKEPVSGIKYTMSYLGSSIEYGTLDPQTSHSEFVSFTGITQNSDGTAQLTGVTRGLSRTLAGGACTASTTLAQSHAGQSIFIISDSPCFFAQYATLNNAATVSAIWTYTAGQNPKYSAIPSSFSSTDLVPYATLLATAIQGAGTSTENAMGIVQLATNAQASAGTASSTTGAPLVLKAGSATSTCQVAQNSVLVSSSTTGKLGGNCIDTTYSYSLSGKNIFTASTTFTATSTFAGTSTTSNAVIFNGVPYSLPSTNGASSTVLSNDSKGDLTWETSSTAAISTTTTFNAATTVSSSASKTVFCVSPKIAVGGGYSGIPGVDVQSGPTYGIHTVSDDYPNAGAWTVTDNCSGNGVACTSGTITIYAMCVNP